MNTSERAPGTAILYFCATNFEFGDGQREQSSVCGEEGQWSPTVATCQSKCHNYHLKGDRPTGCQKGGGGGS